MNTTLNISKSICKIVTTSFGASVSTHKIGNFASIIENLTEVTITGLTSDNKLQKFQKQLTEAGFNAITIHWCQNAEMASNDTAVNFNITYSK